MEDTKQTKGRGAPETPRAAGLVSILKPYRWLIALLVFAALLSNGINLVLPQFIQRAIDSFTAGDFRIETIVIEFAAAAAAIFVFTYIQSVLQTYTSERVARDMRNATASVISRQSNAFVERSTSSKLLTNLTSDADNVKMFVSMAVVSLASSAFIIVGASILLFRIDWKLTLAVLAILPIITGAFFFVMSKMRPLFKRTQEVIDWLNRVINESIMGSSLIRVLNSQMPEYEKFMAANSGALDLGLKILSLFAVLIPIITFVANMAGLIILVLGGKFVIGGSMTLGDFAAFNSYLALLIFPIIIIGFISNVISRAQASYQRISDVLNVPLPKPSGTFSGELLGNIGIRNLEVRYGEKRALKDVSLAIRAGTKNAIIGPTAAGKTQLLYALTGLVELERPDKPDENENRAEQKEGDSAQPAPAASSGVVPRASGLIEYDGKNIAEYDPISFHRRIGFVFQDSIVFNLSVRENIAFGGSASDEDLAKAIETAELGDFIKSLPEGLDTIISERGTSLSGGQKQRLMLARALALNPSILLLDEFTARVDINTEKRVFDNIEKNYPNITLISVTQKIVTVEAYDQIALLMEGELLATGTHEELLKTSPEYVQIYNSQQSTEHI